VCVENDANRPQTEYSARMIPFILDSCSRKSLKSPKIPVVDYFEMAIETLHNALILTWRVIYLSHVLINYSELRFPSLFLFIVI